ncbi:hypothetical protein [Isoptericola sp. b408]|uniref:hypothetical protein n=1 Tax=Isoptericola sp. b408 TaxID=3064653 RepID=UPI0027123AC7|nr:hypothetical protein [Isoptericola sp. b408]MDO8150870.1 hypothetical protein [Isoptericola sp. b408]
MSTTLADLGIDVDLRVTPWHYPGPAAPTSGLLHDGTFGALRHDGGTWVGEDGTSLDELLARARVPARRHRHAVVAIGSNAVPGVMHRKFTRLGVSTTVPMLHGALSHVSVGHIPRVNPAGYVAAVPRRASDVRSAVVVSLLTTEQVVALDVTEHSYVRRSGADGLHLAGHDGPWSLYVSTIGAISGADGAAVPLGTQSALWDLLHVDADLAAVTGRGGHRAVARRLAADRCRRDRVSRHLLERGRVTGTGLESLAAAA